MTGRKHMTGRKKQYFRWTLILLGILLVSAVGIAGSRAVGVSSRQREDAPGSNRAAEQTDTEQESNTALQNNAEEMGDNVLTWQADVTGDGIKDTIRVEIDKVEMPQTDTEQSVTVISGSSGEVIYGLSVNLVHAGWKGVYLYRDGEHTSLMTWQPMMYQGLADYQWKIFDLSEDGREIVLAGDDFSFDLNHVKKDDPEKLEKFVEELNAHLKKAERVIETNDGELLTGNTSDGDQGGNASDDGGNGNIRYDAEEELQEMRRVSQ